MTLPETRCETSPAFAGVGRAGASAVGAGRGGTAVGEGTAGASAFVAGASADAAGVGSSFTLVGDGSRGAAAASPAGLSAAVGDRRGVCCSSFFLAASCLWTSASMAFGS